MATVGQQFNIFGRMFKCNKVFSASHDGIDLDLVSGEIKGTQWLNLRAGIVLSAKADAYGGKYILIKHDDGTGHWTLHHDQLLVSAGQRVEKGQPIAICGNSGYVLPAPTPQNPNNGTHVHLSFQTQAGNWKSHIDPTQFLLDCISEPTTPAPTPPTTDPDAKVKSGNFELVTTFKNYKPIGNRII